ncbi:MULTISPECIES: hypothetical protein [unclassified Gluconobacter]|uniref:hypothetical protein n=1 Tax=unclassified Gluconobacter TaxID=2644261 RepID=UPI0019245E36|nr:MULTISPECIES: hypothetical protein [unclassified Gluconobacter]
MADLLAEVKAALVDMVVADWVDPLHLHQSSSFQTADMATALALLATQRRAIHQAREFPLPQMGHQPSDHHPEMDLSCPDSPFGTHIEKLGY